MPSSDRKSLWGAVASGDCQPECRLYGRRASIGFQDLHRKSSLGGRAEDLRGRSVLVATEDQLAAGLAIVELDGIAGRLIICPPLAPEQLRFVIETASVDAIVTDRGIPGFNAPGVASILSCAETLVPADYERSRPLDTEWILLTSGTTGLPKLVVHTLASLVEPIRQGPHRERIVWSTFYDVRRYGGLQIFLRAVLTGTSLVLPDSDEPAAEFLARAGGHGVTHISGTPSHWRRALMSASAHMITPEYVRLSGEIADQSILDHLRFFYPKAKIVHAFASTEAGVAFEVTDGFEGFPAGLIDRDGGVELKVEYGSLRIRSTRTADRYLGHTTPLKEPDGFVDTRDLVELRAERYHFVGRRDGVVNVGGLKVHPEEVEAVINRHPKVRMSVVRARKNSITGALVVADVVLSTETGSAERVGEIRHDIFSLCHKCLPSYKVPAAIRFVPALAVTETGKLVRNDA